MNKPELSGATNSILNLTNVQAGDAVTASSPYGWAKPVDYDNDGWQDLLVAPQSFSTSLTYRLLHNDGSGVFRHITEGPLANQRVHISYIVVPSWGDYDNDGFLDLYISAGNGLSEVNYLYRNNLKATGNTHHWLKVKLLGVASNHAGVGAKIRVKATIRGQTVWQLRQVEAPGTPDTQNQGFLAHFGLGDATKLDTLRIEWPSGIVQELKDVAVDQEPYLTVRETQNVPLPPPQVTASGRTTDGTFQATVTYATMNALCVLEASTNLVQWTMLSVRTNTTGTVQFDDPGATNRPARFYRVVVP